jgi:hypothetical protein
MKHMTIFLFAIAFVTGMMLWGAPVIAADTIEVLKIETMLMEKGADNVSLTVKAFVKNNGDAADIAIGVVALDGEGFELEQATLKGSLKSGQTKVLVGMVNVKGDVYDKIVKWEWKK